MKISRGIFSQEGIEYQSLRGCSKKFVQQGRRQFFARSVREHGKLARTALTAFSNNPCKGLTL